jgi:Vacuolar-sorting protein 54, of GARP complex
VQDVVELQLLREVAGRSESFFRTAEGTQELLAQLSSSAACVRSLRASLATADEQLCSTAARVTALQARRRNLAAVLDISSGLEEVVAAQAALQCMRQAQDHAGSLELLGQLTSLLEQQPALRGLQCVRHLPPLLVDAGAAAERALTDDFLNAAAHSNAARIVADAVADANAEPGTCVLVHAPAGLGCANLVLGGGGKRAASAAAAAAAAGLSGCLEPLFFFLTPRRSTHLSSPCHVAHHLVSPTADGCQMLALHLTAAHRKAAAGHWRRWTAEQLELRQQSSCTTHCCR